MRIAGWAENNSSAYLGGPQTPQIQNKKEKSKMAKKIEAEEPIIITQVEEGSLSAVLVGRSPLVLNRMAEKAMQQILYPSPKKTTADKAATMKHNPIEEYRNSVERLPDGPTLLAIQSAAPKKALAAAALDIPGSATKAKIGRLTWVPGQYLPIYGTPHIFMSIVRMADMNHTPDVRTRAIVPQWAIPLSINFVEPMLNPTIILNLLVAAGLYIGIGDGRNQKGGLNFGQFEVMSSAVAKQNKDVQAIFAQGRNVQVAAMDDPDPYDTQTAELLSWFELERKTRGKRIAAVA